MNYVFKLQISFPTAKLCAFIVFVYAVSLIDLCVCCYFLDMSMMVINKHFLCCKSHGTLQQIKNDFYFHCLTGIN